MKSSWSIVVKNVTETVDDEGMDHCDNKGMEHCDGKGMEHCDDQVVQYCEEGCQGAL